MSCAERTLRIVSELRENRVAPAGRNVRSSNAIASHCISIYIRTDFSKRYVTFYIHTAYRTIASVYGKNLNLQNEL